MPGQCAEAAARRQYHQSSPLTSWSAQLVGSNGALVAPAGTSTSDSTSVRLQDVINAVLDLVDLDDFAEDDDNDASHDSFGYDPSQDNKSAQHDYPQ